MVLGLVIVTVVMRLWDAPFHVPFNSAGDGILNLVGAKGMIDHGWFFTNHQLSAPVGQEAYDYSAFDGDTLQLIGWKILTLGTSDPVLVVNAYFVSGFAVVSGATFLVTRALGFSRPAALLGSALFTALPYHFDRGASHLFLGDYFAVPAACWLMLTTLTGRPILAPVEGATGWRRWRSWRTAAVVVACVVAGGSTLYYAVFTVLFVGLCAVLRAVTARSWRAGVPGILVAVAVGVVFIVSISPALVYQHEHGRDTGVAARLPLESELYSTSLTQLLLPIQGHRISAFAKLTARHDAGAPVSGEVGQHVGLLLALSFLGLLLLAAARLLRGPPAVLSERAKLASAAAVGAVLTFLWATFGGFSALFAYIVSPQIRAWSRLTPFIAFFALVGLLTVVDLMRARITDGRGTGGRALAAVAVAALGLIGLLDQTSKGDVPSYAAARASWTNNARFVHAIEASVPKGSMILQLPFHQFPETGPVNGMGDYDLFTGYVHSRDLSWSFGGMKGRPEDWTTSAAGQPLPSVLRAAVAAGFAGVYIDRAAYADHGVAVERTVKRVLGDTTAVTGDDAGRLVFYSAAPLAAQERQRLSAAQRGALADALIHPISLSYTAGAYGQETAADGGPFHWLSNDATLPLQNPEGPRPTVLSARASATGGTMTVTVPGRAPKTYNLAKGIQKISIPFTVPAGSSQIRIRSTAPRQPGDPRDLHVQLIGARLVPAAS
jgi:hypothetical protein